MICDNNMKKNIYDNDLLRNFQNKIGLRPKKKVMSLNMHNVSCQSVVTHLIKDNKDIFKFISILMSVLNVDALKLITTLDLFRDTRF